VRVSLRSVAGVDSVDVSLEKGLATVKMKSRNTATLKQLKDAITKNGFAMKASNAVVAGTIFTGNGKLQLKVSGSADVLDLVPDSPKVVAASSMQGKSVLVSGTIPEGQKGKVPDSITYTSITEETQK